MLKESRNDRYSKTNFQQPMILLISHRGVCWGEDCIKRFKVTMKTENNSTYLYGIWLF